LGGDFDEMLMGFCSAILDNNVSMLILLMTWMPGYEDYYRDLQRMLDINVETESYYFGRMVGDVLSIIAGTENALAGAAAVGGSILTGAVITISSYGTATLQGVSISVAGATAGVAVAVASAAVTAYSIGNLFDDRDRYLQLRSNRMNARSSGSGTEGAGNTNFPKSSSDIKRVYGVDEKTFHREIKPEIIKQIQNNPTYSKVFKRMGNNPDIGIDPGGNIVLKNVRTGTELQTNWPIKSFLP
jgi:hypothetical protein